MPFRFQSGRRGIHGMSSIILTLQQARNLHLAAQGLLRPPRGRATQRRMLVAIETMQLLQIDTIHVVARSPYFVLFSRLGAYPSQWLDDALASGDIFECWAHEACFAPIADFALHRHGTNQRDRHWAYKRAQRMHSQDRASMDRLLEHVRASGPVKSSDFERTLKGNAGWWQWKDEKRWLEAWFALGELMILRREKFQRVYEITERVLDGIGLQMPETLGAAEIRRAQMLRAVRALGVAQARWIADYFRSGRRFGDDELEAHVASGELLAVSVKGWERPAYVHRDHAALLELAAGGRLRATHTTLLSPFDPVVWDRARARDLFDFDYTIECYTPQPKRRYGYFVLPILRRGRLVGRLDAKAHRADGVFEVKTLYLEPGRKVDAALAADLGQAIQSCADWHETPRVEIGRCESKLLAQALQAAPVGSAPGT
jgi:uncharacterized protein YcaQ